MTFVFVCLAVCVCVLQLSKVRPRPAAPRPFGSRVAARDFDVDSLDYSKKVLHYSWHPRENIIAVAGLVRGCPCVALMPLRCTDAIGVLVRSLCFPPPSFGCCPWPSHCVCAWCACLSPPCCRTTCTFTPATKLGPPHCLFSRPPLDVNNTCIACLDTRVIVEGVCWGWGVSLG